MLESWGDWTFESTTFKVKNLKMPVIFNLPSKKDFKHLFKKIIVCLKILWKLGWATIFCIIFIKMFWEGHLLYKQKKL